MCSSWASTASEVNRGAVGSIHTDRPSDARRSVMSVGSRSTRSSMTRSADRSMASSQRRPDSCDTGRCPSQIAWITSGRPHDERCADTASTTSLTVITSAGAGLRAASFDVIVELVDGPAGSAASVRHRVARSAAPWPDLRDRVSAAASRVNAARSHRDGSRPCRWRNSSTLAARATSMSPLRLENTAISSLGTPAISACPLTIGRHSTPNRWVSSARSTDWYSPPSIR